MRNAKIAYLEGRNSRIWAIGGFVGCLVLALLGWFIVIGPASSHVSSLKSQTTDAQLTNDQLRGKITALQAEEAKISTIRQSLSDARDALPVTAALPALTRQIQAEVITAQVGLGSLTAGAPTIAKPGATSTAATSTAASTVDPVGSTFEIPMTLVTGGSLANQRTLLEELQHTGPRLALVQSVSFSSQGSTVASIDVVNTMTVQFDIFLTPQTPAAAQALAKQLAGTSGH